MNVTIINDCRDSNAAGRQLARMHRYFGSTTFIGVTNDLEAAGNIIDVLDAVGDSEHVLVVNVAPRNGEAKQYENGSPFCYVRFQNTLLVSSLGGRTLSLVKKLRLVDTVKSIDLKSACDILLKDAYISERIRNAALEGQFRSFDFLPFAGAYLSKHSDLPHSEVPLSNIADCDASVWLVDSFGNCKTTLLSKELEGKMEYKTSAGTFPVIPKLRDIPDSEIAFIFGSSGFGEDRFVELANQGGSAAKQLSLTSGSAL